MLLTYCGVEEGLVILNQGFKTGGTLLSGRQGERLSIYMSIPTLSTCLPLL